MSLELFVASPYVPREGRRLVLGHPGGVVVEALHEAPSAGVKLQQAGVLRATDAHRTDHLQIS